ncbi:MAG: hypothetical protein JKY65_28010 [Planctomycetes bacterium]|nr:hypothetical protein [Planctomycetota bacterium]
MSTKPRELGSFVRSVRFSVAIFTLLGLVTWAIHVAHEIALSHPALISGWALVGAMIFLTLYNLRKKLDFLPAFFASRHWLWGHLVIGYWSVWAFVLHVGVRLPDGILETVLWLQFVGVVASGVFGHYVSRRFPALMADRGQEALYERIPVLIRAQREHVAEVVLRVAREGESTAIPDFYTEHLLDFLSGTRNGLAHLLSSHRHREKLLRALDALEQISQREEVEVVHELREIVSGKDDLDYQYAHMSVLKYWLFFHVPLAYSLLVVSALHVVLAYAFGGIS